VRVVVQHRSRYHYPRPALLGPQLIRLRPADHTRARIETYQLLVELAVETRSGQRCRFANLASRVDESRAS
jgi:hypothetical protein